MLKSLNDLAAIVLQAEATELPEVVTETPDLEFELAEEKKLQTEYNMKELPGFKLIESNMTTIDGNPAYKIVYLVKPDVEPEPDRWFKFMELVSIKNDMRYSFSFAIYPCII